MGILPLAVVPSPARRSAPRQYGSRALAYRGPIHSEVGAADGGWAGFLFRGSPSRTTQRSGPEELVRDRGSPQVEGVFIYKLPMWLPSRSPAAAMTTRVRDKPASHACRARG
jgi:hypothetical protein